MRLLEEAASVSEPASFTRDRERVAEDVRAIGGHDIYCRISKYFLQDRGRALAEISYIGPRHCKRRGY